MSKFIFLILFLSVVQLNAQKRSNLELQISAGVLWDWLDEKIYLSGPFLYVEPRLKTSKRTVIGLRIGVAHNTQSIQSSAPDQFLLTIIMIMGMALFHWCQPLIITLVKATFVLILV